MVELTWDSITRSESDEESMSFCFQYNRPDKPARWVKVYTPYVIIINIPLTVIHHLTVIHYCTCSTHFLRTALIVLWRSANGRTAAIRKEERKEGRLYTHTY